MRRPDDRTPAEEPLVGGNASGAVVRIGDTVRKPWLPSSERVADFMSAVRRRGVDVPHVWGRDDEGRQILEFVPGRLAMEGAPLEASVVWRVGELVRRIHEAAADLPVPADWPVLLPSPEAPDLICHHDLAPWNLIIDGERLVFIDWDGAGPSTRGWDLAYAALAFAHLFPGADVHEGAHRLGVFADGYAADRALRRALPGLMVERAVAMHRMLREAHHCGREPWGSMYLDGHGAHWAGTVEVLRRHRALWQAVLT